MKGLPTGNWVRVLTTPSETLHEMTHSFYDKKARPLRTYQSNHLGGYTQTDVKLDFIGTALYTVTKHKKTNTDAEITVLEGFDYTPEGRLLEHTHKINNLAIETLSHNEYDELGQLIIKRVGKIPSTPLQTVDYKYNIRGWLTDINNVETLGDDLFAFKLSYNDVKNPVWGLVKPLYNGNISETFWKTSTDNQIRKYGYIYDDLNRLDNSIYQKAPTVNAQNSAITSYDSYNEGNVIYDKNGNIIQIRRNGDLDSEEFNIQIDWLFYTYDSGNKLLRVSDGSNHPEGFKDGANTTIEYGYDAFGNMTQDLNKGIPANGISYNHLNLPKQILFSGIPNRKINYLYNALGQKVEKTVENNTTVTTTNYISGFHYENDALKFFATAEGYVNHTLSQGISFYNYIYNYTDHLGNNRLSYTLNQTLGNVVIYEQNHYYPFGLKHEKYGVTAKQYIGDEDTGYYTGNVGLTGRYRRNEYQYKYNGKEFQDELGLNFYDYGARNYDPAIGRWMNVDPLADTTMELYSYVGNNPILFTDPTGMSRESTHIDDVGNVIAVVKDGDLGVYQHGRNADGGALTQYMIEKRQEKLGTSAGGTKVGETWTELGFADFDAYSEGKVKAQEGAFIDLDSNWATEKVSEVIRANPSNTEYISKAQGGGDWDMKRRSPNGNIAYGSLLFGKYASARDAGNFTAGAFAQMQVLVPNAFYDYGFGLYNQSGNNFKKSAVMGFIHLTQAQKFNFKPMIKTAKEGEHPLSRAGIEAGKSFIKSLQK